MAKPTKEQAVAELASIARSMTNKYNVEAYDADVQYNGTVTKWSRAADDECERTHRRIDYLEGIIKEEGNG